MTRAAPGAAVALSVLALLPAGCTERTDLVARADLGAACTNPGPPIRLGTSAPCAGAVAAQRLRYALCSCTALILERGLFTDGGSGPPMRGGPPPPAPPAAVGTDDYLQIAGPVQVAGVLEAAGTAGAGFYRTSAVLGALRSGGPLVANTFLTVGGDAFAGGDVLGRIDVGGVLHAPDDAQIAASVTASAVVREPVTVAPPCDCGAAPPFDLAALVGAHAADNANAHGGVSSGAWSDGKALDLPCGEYYLAAVRAPAGAELELRVHGRAALFVGGDVALENGLRIKLDPDAELDLVVAGSVSVQTGIVGTPMASAVRLWVGGATIKLGGGAALSALVYAPDAVVFAPDDLAVSGALFAGGVATQGDVSVHFDSHLLSGGAVCGAAAESPVQ